MGPMQIKTTFLNMPLAYQIGCNGLAESLYIYLHQSTVRLFQLTCMHTSLRETNQCIITSLDKSAEYKHSLEVCYISMAITSAPWYTVLNTRNYVGLDCKLQL